MLHLGSQNNEGNIISDQYKEAIMRKVLEDKIPPTDLAKKYGIAPNTIRDWIKKAGHSLPKNYKRSRQVLPFHNNSYYFFSLPIF